jgi:hypothetical protein
VTDRGERDIRPIARFDFDPKYDFAYRPRTYWAELPTEEAILSRIKGSARRAAARKALETGSPPPAPIDFVLKESLDEDERWRSSPLVDGR